LHNLPFGKLLAVPKDGKAISKYPNYHDAFLEVTLAIKAAAIDFDAAPELASANSVSRAPSLPAVRPGAEIRSSNLRVKKTFTQREKDKFERDAYEYIEKAKLVDELLKFFGEEKASDWGVRSTYQRARLDFRFESRF
jgi:hypothetical protein